MYELLNVFYMPKYSFNEIKQKYFFLLLDSPLGFSGGRENSLNPPHDIYKGSLKIKTLLDHHLIKSLASEKNLTTLYYRMFFFHILNYFK